MNAFISSLLTVDVLVPVILIPGTTAIGIAIKTCWDRYSSYKHDKREAIRKNHLDKLKSKLDFYWPLYMRLRRDKDIWDMTLEMSKKVSYNHVDEEEIELEVVDRSGQTVFNGDSPILRKRNQTENSCRTANHEDSIVEGIMLKLDKIVLKNHVETVEMIENNIVSAEPRSDIAKLLMQYNRHVIMYKSLREEGDLSFPRKFGAPFPRELLPTVEKRLFELQKQYNDIVEYENDLISKWKCKSRCVNCNRCSSQYCRLCRRKCRCPELEKITVEN